MSLHELKLQIDRDVIALVAQMRAELKAELRAELLAELRSELNSDLTSVKSEIRSVKTEIKSKEAGAIVPASQMQVIRQETAELIAKVGTQIQNNVYGVIIKDINTNVMPKVQAAADWIKFNTEDGDKIVADYRMEQYRGNLLTDGKTKTAIAPGVSTVYSFEM